MLKAFQKFQTKLVRELEKKLGGKHVALIAQRRILPKEKKGQKRMLAQKRPKRYVQSFWMIIQILIGENLCPISVFPPRSGFKGISDPEPYFHKSTINFD